MGNDNSVEKAGTIWAIFILMVLGLIGLFVPVMY